jgi:hypothetical protein
MILNEFGGFVALVDQLVDAGAADTRQTHLSRDEECVDCDQYDDKAKF